MKKYASIFALLLVAMMLFASCTPAPTHPIIPEGTTPEETTPEETTPEATTPEETTPEETTPEETTPEETTPEETTPEETTPEEVEPENPAPMPKKILAIGNSFSDDAMEHLAEILVAEGYTDFILGNLYVGGCTLDGHYSRIESGAEQYDFRVNTGSGWNSSKKSIQYGLEYADWDIVTIQQASGSSGVPETYNNLQNIVDYVRVTLNNPDLKIYWHMTWAYQANSNHAEFPKYDKNQMTMYNAILNTVKEQILTNYTIDGVIPNGTAIQNLRTSYLGDTITRDGYHLSYDIGRYTAALMWYKTFWGADLTDLTVVPQKYPTISSHLPAIKEAVDNAFETPFEVTASTHTERENLLNVMTESDKAYLTGLGLNPDDYELLDLGMTLKAYYNSTTSTSSNLVTTAGNSKGFNATKLFTKETMPVGSVINIVTGYQYRLEGWQTLGVANALARRANSTSGMIVDETLWTQYNYIGFNLSKTAGGDATVDDFMGFRIYVPKTK